MGGGHFFVEVLLNYVGVRVTSFSCPSTTDHIHTMKLVSQQQLYDEASTIPDFRYDYQKFIRDDSLSGQLCQQNPQQLID